MKYLLLFLITFSSLSFALQKKKGKIIYRSPDIEKSMVYFPKLTIHYREADTLIIDDALVFTNAYSIRPFHMFRYEVSNGQYLEYLYDLKKNNDTTWKIALPDTLQWKHKLTYNEPYVEYYFRHPAYSNYPVVGITHKQCELYCEWLTKKYNEIPGRKFKKVKFRLPTKYEWYAAAIYRKPEGKKQKNVKEFNYYDDNIFPWNGIHMRNKDGLYQANFMTIDESNIYRQNDSVISLVGKKSVEVRYTARPNPYMGIASNLNDPADVTAAVDSYWPNDAGIYNLAGNVEEFVAEYGLTKGGSWNDPGYYLRNTVVENYTAKNEATSSRGFRFVMEVVED